MSGFTLEEIVAMAREAGFEENPTAFACAWWVPTTAFLGRFATLVADKAAAREREEVAQQIETTEWWKAQKWQSALCPVTKKAIAAAIRARGQKGDGL